MRRNSSKQARGKKTLRQKTSTETKIQADKLLNIVDISRFRICPPRMLVKLGYQTALTIANAASAQATKYYYANGAYDIDPSAGNLTMAGFNQWMAIYGVYRVVKVHYKMTFVNLELFPVRIATGFFPAASTTFLITQWNSNEHSKEHNTLGPLTGMGRTVVNRSMNMGRLFDIAAAEGDQNQYYGTSGTNPVTLGSFNISVASFTGANLLANGVGVSFEAEYDLELSFPTPLLQV
jgi:hypothetical protein